MMLAQKFTGKQDVSGWWLSEKYDGCRAFWDGANLRTREAWNVIECPPSLTASLPRGLALDGELWAGYGTFQQMRVLVQTNRPLDAGWQGVRFMVFDAPTTAAVGLESRWLAARELARGERVQFVEQHKVRDGAEALREMERIVRAGGEGVVLRRPGHCYSFGRSSCWLKVKPAGID
jgi:DNA ligase-1